MLLVIWIPGRAFGCPRHQGPVSCRIGRRQRFLLLCALPSRRAHTDDTIEDLLLLVLIFLCPHDLLAGFEPLTHLVM